MGVENRISHTRVHNPHEQATQPSNENNNEGAKRKKGARNAPKRVNDEDIFWDPPPSLCLLQEAAAANASGADIESDFPIDVAFDRAMSAVVSACGSDVAAAAKFTATAGDGRVIDATHIAKLSKVLYDTTCTGKPKGTFVTEEIRDGFFIPLAKHATTPYACHWLAAAICGVTRGASKCKGFVTEVVKFARLRPDPIVTPVVTHGKLHKGVFATESVRDKFFLPLVKHATTPSASQSLAVALCSIVSGRDGDASRRQALFATAAFRDGFFLPLANHAASADASQWLASAMRNIIHTKKDIFATEDIRDKFFLPLVKHATTPSAAQALADAVYSITCGAGTGAAHRRRDVFAANGFRNGFVIPLAKCATIADASHSLAAMVRNIASGGDETAPRRRDIFSAEAMRDDFFIPLAKHATTSRASGELAYAMSIMVSPNGAAALRRRAIFGTESVRDKFFLPLVKHATTPLACRWVATAMNFIIRGTDAAALTRKDTFATEAIRDHFFLPLAKHADPDLYRPDAARWLVGAMGHLVMAGDVPEANTARPDMYRADLFATATIRDQLLAPFVTPDLHSAVQSTVCSVINMMIFGDDDAAFDRESVLLDHEVFELIDTASVGVTWDSRSMRTLQDDGDVSDTSSDDVAYDEAMREHGFTGQPTVEPPSNDPVAGDATTVTNDDTSHGFSSYDRAMVDNGLTDLPLGARNADEHAASNDSVVDDRATTHDDTSHGWSSYDRAMDTFARPQ